MTPLSFFLPLVLIIVLSHLEVVDLHEGLVRVQGVFNRGRARFTNLTGALRVRPAGTQQKRAREPGVTENMKTGDYYKRRDISNSETEQNKQLHMVSILIHSFLFHSLTDSVV